MATNNAINLSSSGIVSYNGSGTFSALANPLIVANGGSGITSDTAYAVLCGGTTSTGNLQSIASVGTATHVLTSNGAAALPTFQAAPTSSNDNLVFVLKTLTGDPADSTTYYLFSGATLTTFTAATSAGSRYYAATASTITAVYGVAIVAGTLGGAQNCTLALRLNNTTDTTITSTLAMSSAANAFSNTGLSISMSAGDYVEFKLTCPAFSPNPTTVSISATVLLT